MASRYKIFTSRDGTLSGANTGDQVADGVTISGAGTIADPFVAIGGGANVIYLSAREGNVGAINRGQVVYVNGASSELPTIALAGSALDGAIGIANTTFVKNGSGTVVTEGLLDDVGVDSTVATGSYINPLHQTWAAGDTLYLSTTLGGCTNIPPTTGRTVIVGHTIKGNSLTDHIQVHIIIAAPLISTIDGEDIIQRVGDAVGANKVSFRNKLNAEVASIDSLGNIAGLNLTNHNHGDQVGDGISISGAGTALDPFRAIGGGATATYIHCKEMNVSAILKGQPVYISGAAGNIPIIGLADSDSATAYYILGVAMTNFTKDGEGDVLTLGLLDDTGVDTTATNLTLNPNAETWLAGDRLYTATTAGGITNVRPLVGRNSVIGYSIKGSSLTDHLVILTDINPACLNAQTTSDIIIRTGDNAGVNKILFKNYANTSVASIDSLGNIAALNLSSTNTGDNAVNSNYSSLVTNANHSGEVTGATALTITNKAITLAKMADLAPNIIIGRVTNSTGVPEALSAANVRTIINVENGANIGVIPNLSITPATNTKITYDAKGLVTSGTSATTADIADSSNKRYVTDANLLVIGNTSGTNSGDNATNTQYSPLLTVPFVTIGGDATLSGERSLAVTANQLALTDGGANSTATLGIAANVILPGTGAMIPPIGTTGQQPTPSEGMIRYNTTTHNVENYNGSYWARVGLIKQYITGNIAPASLGATQIPFDNTSPTITEGTQIWTQSITPLSATNKIIIRFSVMVDEGSNGRGVAIALFRGSVCLDVKSAYITTTAFGATIAFNVTDIPGVTTATTYSARCGASGNGNVFVNRTSGDTFGGSVNSSYTLEEILP